MTTNESEDFADGSSEWVEGSEEASSASWTYQSSRPRNQSAILAAVSDEDPRVNDCIASLKKFYSLHDGGEYEHAKLYEAFKEAFHKHATAVAYPFGTPIKDMKDPEKLHKYNLDGVYFDMFRPSASLRHKVSIISTDKPYADVGMFQYTTQEEYAGHVLTVRFKAVAREGKIFRLEHEETFIDSEGSGLSTLEEEKESDASSAVSSEMAMLDLGSTASKSGAMTAASGQTEGTSATSESTESKKKSRNKIQKIITWGQKFSKAS